MAKTSVLHSYYGEIVLFINFVVVCMVGILIAPCHAYAMVNLHQIAFPGKPSQDIKSDWPEGTINIINDSLRTNGYHVYFAGLIRTFNPPTNDVRIIRSTSTNPNDVRRFEIKVQSNDDIQHIINVFACIEARGLCILLNPESDSGAIQFPSGETRGSGIAAVFEIGCQGEIDTWFSNLKTDESGVHQIGDEKLSKAPQAMPPTLSLYVGYPGIDVSKLIIPTKVDVTRGHGGYGNAETKNVINKKITELIDEHNRQRKREGLAGLLDPVEQDVSGISTANK